VPPANEGSVDPKTKNESFHAHLLYIYVSCSTCQQ
jgi:hypothetical protein